ncbi:MAG: hypothetical protein ISS69_11575 [Phycisphaerae bacterium]|nr:hypothetical protein [Planctomycetota bacterium]MBL7220746.1 hypothetical protein [Phycisphaerae bacterium]
MVGQSGKSMEEVIRNDGRYPLEAFAFLHDALNHAVDAVYGPEALEPQDPESVDARHVSGEQLCHAMRDLAIERWGHLAEPVLAKWNIHATLDLGNMVYLLVDNSFMRKTEDDSVEDFRDVYSFKDAFNVKMDLRPGE